MIPSEIRKEARTALKGKWGKAICIILAYSLIMTVLSFAMVAFEKNTLIYMLIYILEIVVSVPFSFGLLISFMKLKRGDDTTAFAFITDGFSQFGKSWGIYFHTFIRLLLPVICVLMTLFLMIILFVLKVNSLLVAVVGTVLYIASIIYIVSRSLLYTLAYYIAFDNSKLSSADCVKKSEELMTGNRGNVFLLYLSFIGWSILSVLTLGIGFIWLMPYIQIALVCFYEKVAKVEVKR